MRAANRTRPSPPLARRRLWTGAVALLALAAPGGRAWGQAATTPPLLPPVSPACVSSPFGPRVMANRPLAGTFHGGIDLPAPEGAAVRAIAPGRIIRIQRHGVGGLEMLVQHDGFIGVYSHLGRVTPVIAEGRTMLRAGEPIGTVGRSGLTYGMHLYFGILLDGHPVDPAPFLAVGPCGGGSAPRAHAAASRIAPTRLYAER